MLSTCVLEQAHSGEGFALRAVGPLGGRADVANSNTQGYQHLFLIPAVVNTSLDFNTACRAITLPISKVLTESACTRPASTQSQS